MDYYIYTVSDHKDNHKLIDWFRSPGDQAGKLTCKQFNSDFGRQVHAFTRADANLMSSVDNSGLLYISTLAARVSSGVII